MVQVPVIERQFQLYIELLLMNRHLLRYVFCEMFSQSYLQFPLAADHLMNWMTVQ